MKKLYILLLVVAFSSAINAQELDSLKTIMNKDQDEKVEPRNDDSSEPVIVDDESDETNVRVLDRDVVKVIENGDTTYVKVGERPVLEVRDHPDSTSIRVGNKEIRILENNDDTDVKISRIDHPRISNPKFRGHWAGFEWGINNFVDNNFSLARNDAESYMDLNTGRSWVANINFAQYSLGFGTSHLGIVTGLGLELNNYFFDNKNTIEEIDDYVSESPLGADVYKSKLTTTFLRVPLILEVQFPNTIRAKRVFLSAGIVGGLKIGSHTKVVYKDNGKSKDKNRDDFNINPFRYGLTARAGFGNLSVFADYYMTTMFVKDKGPELHPFNLGLSFNF
jgi:hypothetical protein